ncbi:MAG: hypothetical protein HOE92_06375 [Euryarchaeota archaeon]|jgi:uncharacterized protein|nr:hypothetical protein [Euryarchaeota archaeon]
MTTKIDWLAGKKELPAHDLFLAALPGVGNVGKLVVDGLAKSPDAKLVARVLHPDMPPQALLTDSRLTPPHLALHLLKLNEKTILLLSGEVQPLSPRGQFEVASELLLQAAKSGCEHVFVLAGLSSEPGVEEVFAICADDAAEEMLSSGGATISTDRPEGGVIGLAGLLSSLGPVYGVSSGCIISTSIGNSVDIHSAERMRLALQNWLNVELPIPITTTEAIAERIEKLMAEYPDSSLGRELLEDNSTSLYA